MQSAEFDYVKINAKTLKDMTSSDVAAGYQTFKSMTDTFDIQIIAVGVDSKELFDELQSLGLKKANLKNMSTSVCIHSLFVLYDNIALRPFCWGLATVNSGKFFKTHFSFPLKAWFSVPTQNMA